MRRCFFGLTSVAILGCGSPPTATHEAPAVAPAPAPVHVTATPTATTCNLPAGQSSLAIEVDGVEREVLLEVGSTLAQPPAVVFTWHGFGSTPEMSRASLNGAALWDDAVVVAGRGLPRTFDQFGDTPRPGWQVFQGEHDDRDLHFFDAIVANLRARGCLDEHRVYTTGFSNGGFFSNVLACHRGTVLAAAAPAGGGGPFVTPCGPTIPVLVTHGRADNVVPYDSARKTFEFWRDHDGCDAGALPPDDGCAAASGCPDNAAVRMCSFDLGHQWPQGQAERTAEFLRRFTR